MATPFDPSDAAAVDTLREYLRICSVSSSGPSSGEYTRCAEFVADLMRYTGAFDSVEIVHPARQQAAARKPVVLGRITGSAPEEPTLVLNSHYDVVPADEVAQRWSVPPFSGDLRDGWIFGRGVQDMKSVTIQVIFALARVLGRRDAVDARKPRRSVFVSVVPDEEIGGTDGALALMKTDHFPKEVFLAIDEGLASEGDEFELYFGERTPWSITVRAVGKAGHGSRFIEPSAVQRLVNVVNRALAFRETQKAKLGHGGCDHGKATVLGDVVSLNCTVLQAGVSGDGGATFSYNCAPSDAVAGFDIRIPPSVPVDEVRALLSDWCSAEGEAGEEVGPGPAVSWEFEKRSSPLFEHVVTGTGPEHAPLVEFLKALNMRHADEQPEGARDGDHVLESAPGLHADSARFCETYGVSLQTFPAATDSRYFRAAKIPALGFSPMRRTPVLLHEVDERLEVVRFNEGMSVYEQVVAHLVTV